jgi:hypothetical protein
LLSQQGFIFVAECVEISTSDLIRDMDAISKLIGIFMQVTAILMTAFINYLNFT